MKKPVAGPGSQAQVQVVVANDNPPVLPVSHCS